MHQYRFNIQNLGCKLNFAEASTIARQLKELGFEQVPQNQTADICIINTCAVTEHSEKKCRQAARKLHHLNPQACIMLTGCYASLVPEELERMPEVHIVARQHEALEKLLAYLHIERNQLGNCENNFFAAYSSGDRTRSFLKVQDGCDYTCSYCTIPLARGKSRNISIAQLVQQAQEIAAKGMREIILTGVNTGDFGRTTGERFIDLLRALDQVEGISRYRISSVEPNLLTNEIIDFVATSSKFLPHFHIPLQAGHNRILGLMRRRYNTEKFASRIQAVKERIPHAFIGIDVIVGFPTETEEEFVHTYQFLQSLEPGYLHVFPYSQRPNTDAIQLEQVPQKQIADRAKRLGALCAELERNFYQRYVGSTAHVLFESSRKGANMLGFTEHYIKVESPYNKAHVNQIVQVRLTGIADNGNMLCEILNN